MKYIQKGCWILQLSYTLIPHRLTNSIGAYSCRLLANSHRKDISVTQKRFGPPIDLVVQRDDRSTDEKSLPASEGPTMNLRQTKELPIYLTLKEVAELLKVKPRTIYAWVSDKRIPYERKGSLLRFRLDAILAWNEPAR